MDERVDPRRRSGALEPLESVVPSRAVLTELARGFLLLHERDPGRASQFAATFLREQAGTSSNEAQGPHPPFVGRAPRLGPAARP